PGNAVDGDPNTYWESVNNAFPQWFQVDLGSATAVGSVVMKLPASWGARTQTLTLSGSTDGSTFSTLAGSAGRTFDPATGNQVTVNGATAQTVTGTTTTVSGLTPATTYSFAVVAIDAAGNLSQASATASAATDAAANANLALGKPTSDSGHTQSYVSSNTVD